MSGGAIMDQIFPPHHSPHAPRISFDGHAPGYDAQDSAEVEAAMTMHRTDPQELTVLTKCTGCARPKEPFHFVSFAKTPSATLLKQCAACRLRSSLEWVLGRWRKSACEYKATQMASDVEARLAKRIGIWRDRVDQASHKEISEGKRSTSCACKC